MKCIAALFALFQLVFGAGLVLAQMPAEYAAGQSGSVRTVETESWLEEWDPATGQWVKVDGEPAADGSFDTIPTVTTTFVNGAVVSEARAAARYAQPDMRRGTAPMLGQYGPFVVTSPNSASIIGSTDSASPAHFDAMLRDFPQLAVLNMVEAPGTSNDIANLAVGRRIREAGIATHVPSTGSVRSGAVELFLAGTSRTLERGAQFAVHSWLDNHGREADDFASNHPAHRLYLDYYVEMGMSETRAREFYAMTNSVPHSSALWLNANDMRPWIAPQIETMRAPLRSPARRALGSNGDARIALALESSRPAFLAIAVEPLPEVQIDWNAAAPLASAPVIAYSDLSAMNLARFGV